MLVDVEAGRQRALHALADQPFDQLRPAAAELVEERLDDHVLPAHRGVSGALGQPPAQHLRDAVLGRQRGDVGGRALQHRHVRGVLRHRRHQGHRGRAAADHDHALAGVVEVLRPVLRVDDRAGEALFALELRREPFVVAVVAAARPEEVAGQPQPLAVLALRLDRPARPLARPLGGDDAVAVADPPLDPVLARGLAHVGEDRGPVGDRLLRRPGLEAVAERVHVGVRADPRVAEEVPGAAEVLARLEDRVAAARAALLQVPGGADPREAGADDQHVEMFGRPLGHGGILADWLVSQCDVRHSPRGCAYSYGA